MKFIKQILTVNLCFTMIVLTVSVSMAFFVIVPLSKKYLLPRFQNEHFRSEQTQKKASKLKANKENKNENRKTNKHSSNSNRIKEAIANHLELYNSKIMKPKNKIKFRQHLGLNVTRENFEKTMKSVNTKIDNLQKFYEKFGDSIND